MDYDFREELNEMTQNFDVMRPKRLLEQKKNM